MLKEILKERRLSGFLNREEMTEILQREEYGYILNYPENADFIANIPEHIKRRIKELIKRECKNGYDSTNYKFTGDVCKYNVISV